MFLGVHNLTQEHSCSAEKSLCSSKISCYEDQCCCFFLSHQQHKLLQSLKGVASVL